MLSFNSDIHFDTTTTTDYSFFGNYSHHAWSFSLSNAQQSSLDTNDQTVQSSGDLYLSSGYGFIREKLYAELSVGMKLATGEDEVSTGENDYFSRLDISYNLTDTLNLLTSLSYTLTGESNETTYNNPFGYRVGVGYLPTAQWYTSLTYQYSDSIYPNGEAYQAISLFNSYAFTESFFGTVSYIRGLDELSYPETLSLGLGVTFE